MSDEQRGRRKDGEANGGTAAASSEQRGGGQRAARWGEGLRRRLARTAGGDRELMCVGAWLWVSFFLTCAWLRVSYLLNLRGFFSFQRGGDYDEVLIIGCFWVVG